MSQLQNLVQGNRIMNWLVILLMCSRSTKGWASLGANKSRGRERGGGRSRGGRDSGGRGWCDW